jgi:hypothetical protein
MTALMEVAVDDRHLHEDCLERDRELLVSDCVAAISTNASAQFGLGCDGSPQAPCHVRLIQ